LCEGSATVVYEAFAAGRPVVCTPNTGSVVRDRADGFIVPIRNSESIVAALELLAKDPDLRRAMSRNATRPSLEFGIDAYGRRLIRELDAKRAPITGAAPRSGLPKALPAR
jgi:glycosyltransferase involved in cell wall biosynthesis